MDDMENNQDFDLEDILKEFGDHPESEEPSEPAGQMPELRFDDPETEEEPAASAEAEAEPAEPLESEVSAEEPVEQPLSDTLDFGPEQTPEAPEVTDEPTIVVDLSEELPKEDPKPAVAEPAFEVEEEFIPAPIVFTPRSRLKELKKQLVAGPERRYYELSEMGIGKLQAALLVNVLVVLICAGVTALFALNLVPENRIKLVVFSQVLAMLISALLGSSLMLDSLGDLLKGRFTVNTLLTLTFAACLIDSVFCLKELRVPCCAAFSLEMTMAMWARLQKHNTEMAQMDTMRKAVRLHGIVRVENYYEGKDGLLRKEGEVSDFMDTYQKMPAPEVVQSVYAVLSLLVCIGISVFAGMLHGLSMGVQILSTSLLVAVPASFFVSISRPMAILETRLHMVGTVLCGWEGVKDLCGKAVFPISDLDLFPQGSTKLNGVKFYGQRNPDEVVSYTTSVIHAAGGGLVPVFDQLLKSRSGQLYSVHSFRNYGDGGIGGEVEGLPVLVGTMSFLQDMGVEIPEGTMVSQAVYAAVDGELCAVYAISYAKMRSAAAGLVTLCGYRKLKPLKLSGDFMMTESFLRSKFNVKTSRIAFPDRDTCQKLQQHPIDPDEPVLALTTREELVSVAYAITGARTLRQATKLGVIIHLIGGTLGLLIMLVLGYLGSTQLLTPANILLYQLIWAVPGLLVTEWARIV
ncbi:MAG: hypothetical protein SPC78_05660 [Candidatus Faecousia sp.]|nr:hypothetical protein [Clostridiales bacterium]MDY4599101.1 hypothetical protein [Candidatus Faecousia sp.]